MITSLPPPLQLDIVPSSSLPELQYEVVDTLRYAAACRRLGMTAGYENFNYAQPS
jgi:hypothetical protein